ncbi:MAG: hypothetical protein ACOVP3_03405 [Rhodoluna sp.]|jgi:ABC-type sugar transport system permease subunit
MTSNETNELNYDANWFALERNTNAVRSISVLLLGLVISSVVSGLFYALALALMANYSTQGLGLFVLFLAAVFALVLLALSVFVSVKELRLSRDYREVQ